MANKIDRFLRLMNDRGASDFHLTVGRPPMFRTSGSMETIRYRILTEEDFVEMMQPVTVPALWESYMKSGDLDFAYEIPGLARYRVNLFRQQRGAHARRWCHRRQAEGDRGETRFPDRDPLTEPRTARQQAFESPPRGTTQRAVHVMRGQSVDQLGIVLVHLPASRHCRNRTSARRILALTVPSGKSSRSASSWFE